MLFFRKLTNTRNETINAAVYDYLHDKGTSLLNLLLIVTLGVRAMTCKRNELVAKLKEVVSQTLAIHCITSRIH